MKTLPPRSTDQFAASGPIDLSDQVSIASGSYRDIYRFPGNAHLLLKVVRHGSQRKPGRPIRNYLKARTLRHRFRFVYREITAYLDACIHAPEGLVELPISHLLGLRQTTFGLAMVVQAIRDESDGIAATLGRLHAEGRVDQPVLAALNSFIADIHRCDVIVNDTNPENIMLDRTGDTPRFVLVDGFGDASLLQLKRRARILRDRSRNRHFAALADRIGLIWNPETRTMTFDK